MELLRGNFYLHLHLGTNRQAVPAALMDGSITVWKEKATENTVSVMAWRVCGKVGARNSDWF